MQEFPSPEQYRHLYGEVGRNYRWTDRSLLSDQQLMDIFATPGFELWVLEVAGIPAGYVELVFGETDCSPMPWPPEECCKVAYFGLFPEFLGRGLGQKLLLFGLEHAWSRPNCQRVWLHTCNHDHVAALPNYLKAGFTPFGQEVYLNQKLREARWGSDFHVQGLGRPGPVSGE